MCSLDLLGRELEAQTFVDVTSCPLDTRQLNPSVIGYHAEGESQSSRRRNHKNFRAKMDSFFSEVTGGYFEKNHKLVKYIGFGTAYEKEEHARSMATAILNFFLKRMITIVEQKKWQHRLEQQILKS